MPHSNHIEITRKELYKQVWNEPTYKVAMKYGLSDVGLAKICNRNNVPKPPLGYWAKLAHGHKVERPELPEAENEQPIKIISSATQIGIEAPELLQKTSTLIDFEHDPKNQIAVAEELIDPLPIIEQARKKLRSEKPDENGLVHSCCKASINVSKPMAPRALRIMDALFKALIQRGYDPEDLRFFDEPVEFRLEEHLDAVVKERVKKWREVSGTRYRYGPDDYDRIPSGRLRLTLHVRMTGDGLQQNWTDGKTQRIENSLNAFICGMARQAAVSREWRLYWARWERERKEEEQRLQAEALRRAQVQYRKDKLRADACAWEQANNLRRYIDAMIEKKGPVKPGSDLEKWVEWARDEAELDDPLANE